MRDFQCEIDRAEFYWPAGNGKYDPDETLVMKQAVQDGKPLGVVLGSESPFLFFSSSAFWFPQGSRGASVPGYTAYFIQSLPDWFYQQGDFNPLVKHLAESPLLHSRRAVVMVGSSETWQGFPPMPRYIQDGARRISLEKTIPAASDEITIDGKGAYSHSADGNGEVRFELLDGQRPDHFDMVFEIPRMEGKHTCMVRVNTGRTSHLHVHLVEEGSDRILDTASFVPGEMHAADFFVPLAEADSRVRIRFQPQGRFGVFVKNIELWYY